MPEEAIERPEPVNAAMVADARLLGIQFSVYKEMSAKERSAAKARFHHKLKSEARRLGVDPDEFVAMTTEERDAARATPANDDVPPDEPDDIPPVEILRRQRQEMTLGNVHAAEGEDLVGTAIPRHFEELFARWPVGDGQHYVRVERTQPKMHQGIPTAGLVGKIESPITEEQFQAYFGGREYEVTVYGPDPKGRTDPNTGLPIIKRKTEPIKLSVPTLDPNLSVLPAAKVTAREETAAMQGQNPFQTLFGFGAGAGPVSAADAAVHKSSLDFVGNILRQKDEELARARSNGHGDTTAKLISESGKQALEVAEKAAATREKTLTDIIASQNDRAKTLEEKVERLLAAAGQSQSGGTKDAIELARVMNPKEASDAHLTRTIESHNEERRRLIEQHDQTIKLLRAQQEDSIAQLRTRQDEELKREQARYRDQDEHWRRKYDDLKERGDQREKELKEEITRVREDERKVAGDRVKDVEKRFEDRIKDLKATFDSELRMKDEHAKTRMDTVSATLQMKIDNALRDVTRAEEEAENARREAEDSKDPIKVKEKAEALAEAFGYSKDDADKNQTTGQRLASTLGMGLGKALEDIPNWLPKTIAEFQTRSQAAAAAAPGRGGAAPQQQQPQQRAVQRQRAVAWASKAGTPVAPAPGQPGTPIPPMGIQPPEQPAQAAAPPPPPEPAPQQPVPEPAPPSEVQDPMQNSRLIEQFRDEVEKAIEIGFAADVFAERFATGFPEPSRDLVTRYRTADIFAMVAEMPGGTASPILRRDGRKWFETMWKSLEKAHAPRAA